MNQTEEERSNEESSEHVDREGKISVGHSYQNVSNGAWRPPL